MDSNLPPDAGGLPPAGASPPPPGRPPPVISPLPAPRPARGRSGWMIFAVVLLALLVISVAVNFFQMVGSALTIKGGATRASGPRLEEVVIKDNDAANKIAVLNVNGVITGQALDGAGYNLVALIKEQLSRATDDKEVKAVILKVDSPGGEVLASDEISRALSDFQAKSKKPVVVSMGSLAASGGYYISAPCEWIVANELTITGSIGVIMHGYNYRGLLDKVGVRPEVYKSGRFKDMLSPDKLPEETTPEERKMVQDLIDETFAQFKQVVEDGRHAAFRINQKRGQALSPNWKDYADGRILSGKEAYQLGFVDELGDFDTAVKTAETLAGIKGASANLIQYQPVFDISNLFRMFGSSDAKAIKLDLGVEIPNLRAGYLYFLSPAYVQ